MYPARLSHHHTATTVGPQARPPPKKPTPSHRQCPLSPPNTLLLSLSGSFSLCPAACPSLPNQLGCFWESQLVIRALISRTSCQQLPEGGQGRREARSIQGEVLAAWDQEDSVREMESQTLPAPALPSLSLTGEDIRPGKGRDSHSRV